MAHVSKYTRSACGGLFAHYDRKRDKDGNYIKLQNQEIDFERTNLNYNLCHNHSLTPNQFLKKRLKEVYHNNRKNQIVMIDWIVTLPDEVNKEDQEVFFKSCYDFIENKYGADNIIGAWVHLDETTPHIHVSITPVLNNEKFDCKSIINRNTLRVFHPELKAYMDEVLGYNSGILNGMTEPGKGSKTVEELKSENSYLTQKRHRLEQQNEELKKEHEHLVVSKVELEKELEDKAAVIEQQEKHISTLKEQLIYLKEKIRILIECIKPLEYFKSIINVIWQFPQEFKNKIIELSNHYMLTDEQMSDLEKFYEVASKNDFEIEQVFETIDEITNEVKQEERLL